VTTVPTAPVLAHVETLGMTWSQISIRAGIPESTLRAMTRHAFVRDSTAAAVMRLRRPDQHPTKINPHNVVECSCGYRSPRYGTLGLAKAAERLHKQ
jgi:lambda repressor-like predicted transcriptional regulator